MLTTILAKILASALMTAGLQAEAPKPLADVKPGHIAWFDITTTSLPKSQEFYGKLFGWQFRQVPGKHQAVIVASGTGIGTLRWANGQITPFSGVVYVQVADLRASLKKAKELGGTLLPEFPFNLPNGAGAIAMVVDPVGHPIGLYSKTPLPPEP